MEVDIKIDHALIIVRILAFQHIIILAVYLNTKHTVWEHCFPYSICDPQSAATYYIIIIINVLVWYHGADIYNSGQHHDMHFI